MYTVLAWASCQIRKIAYFAHAPLSPPPRVSDPDMHYGTCVTHMPWCMSGSLTSGFLWSRWRGKRSRHSRRMRNPQFYVSGKRPMEACDLLTHLFQARCLNRKILSERHIRIWNLKHHWLIMRILIEIIFDLLIPSCLNLWRVNDVCWSQTRIIFARRKTSRPSWSIETKTKWCNMHRRYCTLDNGNYNFIN